LREYPNTEDFVYLNRINSSPNEYDPYSLEVMPFAAIKQDDFYTMSVRGITHYQDGISVDFASESRKPRLARLCVCNCRKAPVSCMQQRPWDPGVHASAGGGGCS